MDLLRVVLHQERAFDLERIAGPDGAPRAQRVQGEVTVLPRRSELTVTDQEALDANRLGAFGLGCCGLSRGGQDDSGRHDGYRAQRGLASEDDARADAGLDRLGLEDPPGGVDAHPIDAKS